MRAAIMQPTYLPWCGYFALMDSVDEFVLLDTVPFSKRSWQQRNRIKTGCGEVWLTVPVLSKGLRGQIISEVKIDTSRDALSAHRTSIEHAYGKAPFFSDYADPLFKILSSSHTRLIDLNFDLIIWLRGVLGIETALVRASAIYTEDELKDVRQTDMRVERLARICECIGAAAYVSPPGALEYVEEGRDAFTRRGIAISYHHYRHPVYDQRHGAFVPYLSVIDLIFAHGPSSLEIIRRGGEKETACLAQAQSKLPAEQ
jgi:hypothetical protein